MPKTPPVAAVAFLVLLVGPTTVANAATCAVDSGSRVAQPGRDPVGEPGRACRPLPMRGHSSAKSRRTYAITTERGFVVRLGPLRVKTHPLLTDAARAFGSPTSTTPVSGACKVAWSALKLRATFTSFGGTSDYCGEGFFQSAVVRSSVWRTWAGLRVGMRSSRVPELHHNATFERGKWVLATQDVYGPEPSPTVSALVRNGRVVALSLWVGAAGD